MRALILHQRNLAVYGGLFFEYYYIHRIIKSQSTVEFADP